jgi:membrane associated rhomboid family serine protease
MFIPLHDSNNLKHIKLQWVTLVADRLNALDLGHYRTWQAQRAISSTAAVLGLGFIPSVVNDFAELPPSLVLVPEDATYITYSFLHGNLLHLGSNMIFLWVFGDNVEDAMGHFRFLIFYLACAAAGAFAHGLLLPGFRKPADRRFRRSGGHCRRLSDACTRRSGSGCWCWAAFRCRCRHSYHCCSGWCSSSSWS